MINRLKKVLGNVYIFSVFTRILMVIVGLLYSILLSRYLGSALKGQLAYINTITAITVIVFSFGIHQAYPYFKKQGTENIERIFTHVCLIAFISYTAVSLCVAALIKGNDTRIIIAVLLTPLLTFTKLITYQAMVEDPNRKNSWEVICELVEIAALLLLLLFAERSLYFSIAVIVGKNIMACIYYLRMVNADLHFSREDFRMLRRFAAFGFLPMLSLLMNNLNYRIDVLMLGNAVSDSQVGIYSLGIQIAEKIWLISDALRDVLFSKLIKGKDSEEVNKVLRICICASAILVASLIIFGKPFITVCYGKEFKDAYNPLIIVLFGTLVMVFYKIIQAYNIVHHKQRMNFVFLTGSVIVNIVMNALLIPPFGILGAAAASLISYTVCATLFVVEYIKATDSRFKDVLVINRQDINLLMSFFRK